MRRVEDHFVRGAANVRADLIHHFLVEREAQVEGNQCDGAPPIGEGQNTCFQRIQSSRGKARGSIPRHRRTDRRIQVRLRNARTQFRRSQGGNGENHWGSQRSSQSQGEREQSAHQYLRSGRSFNRPRNSMSLITARFTSRSPVPTSTVVL